jgi:RNA-directed DNA polymerase
VKENWGAGGIDAVSVVMFESVAESELEKLHPGKTRLVHISWGFEFLGYKLKKGKCLKLSESKLSEKPNAQEMYAVPKEQAIRRFLEQIRLKTKRKVPLLSRRLSTR